MTPLILLLCLITLCHALITTNIAVSERKYCYVGMFVAGVLVNIAIRIRDLTTNFGTAVRDLDHDSRFASAVK